jgi:hypothetical protein
MEPINILALMREATRRVEADYTGALLIQVSAAESAEIPDAFVFWFNNQAAGDPSVRTIILRYKQGLWGVIERSAEPLLGALSNDLLRIEIGLQEAVGYIRASGYTGPLVLGGLLQPVSHPIPPNPLYNFAPSPTSNDYIFVDAVTGAVSKQSDGGAGYAA